MNLNKIPKTIIATILIVAIILTIGYYFYSQEKTQNQESFHIHTDFALYLNDSFFDLAKEKYMTGDNQTLSNGVHLHDNHGDVVHFHDERYDMIDFIDSLGFSLNETCLVVENISYCENENYNIGAYINGEKIDSLSNYIPQDLDRILLIYSNKSEEEIINLTNNVTDNACIQSLTCPERGDPIDESSCAGSSCAYTIGS